MGVGHIAIRFHRGIYVGMFLLRLTVLSRDSNGRVLSADKV